MECHAESYSGLENNDFYILIGQYVEKRNMAGGTAQRIVSWKEATNIYDIYYYDIARDINKRPAQYLSDAIRVLSDSHYDQSQKLYSILLMQHLPINDYICLMRVANESFENGNIDKEVMRFALFPDPNIKSGTSVYYWWLPAWRDQFMKNAYNVADQESVDEVLSGKWSLNLIIQ